jgi:hypothetical protein
VAGGRAPALAVRSELVISLRSVDVSRKLT